MKKFITVAALLAAGTAFANAVTLDDAILSVVNPVGTTDLGSIDGNTSVNFSYTFTLDADNLVSIIGQSGKSATTAPTLVSVSAGSGRAFGTGVGNPSDDGSVIEQIGIYTTLTAAAANTAVGTYRQGENIIGTGDDLCSADNVAGVAVTLAYSNSNTGSKLYLTVLGKDGTTYSSTVSDATLRWTNDSVAPTTLSVNPDAGVTSFYLFNSTLSAADAASANVAAIAAAIPEPSAFGLLAGVGALALVASRRRRVK